MKNQKTTRKKEVGIVGGTSVFYRQVILKQNPLFGGERQWLMAGPGESGPRPRPPPPSVYLDSSAPPAYLVEC